jgi:hypothetical protein
MRAFVSVSLALSACAAADPPTPEAEPVVEQAPSEPVGPGQSYRQRTLLGPGELQVRAYLQDVISDRFGAPGWNSFNSAPTAIAAASLPGRWATSHAPQVSLLIRGRDGWRAWGGTRPIGPQVSAELDSLLADRRFWAEPGRYPEIACTDSGADVMWVRHSGRTKMVYQSGGCGTPNLSTRLIQAAISAK